MNANQPKAGHCEICGGLAHRSSPFTTVKDGKFYHKLCLNVGCEPLKWKEPIKEGNINCDYKDNCENHLRNCWFCDRNEVVTITQDNYSPKSYSLNANQQTSDKP